MCLQEVALLQFQASTTCHKNRGQEDSIRTTTCRKTVVGVSKGMHPVKYFC